MLDNEEITDDDEFASLQAYMRALSDLIEKHNLVDELEELRLKYLPEEVQKRRDWWAGVCARTKVKVTTEGN